MNHVDMRKKFYDSAIRAVLMVIALMLLLKFVAYLPMLQDLWISQISMQGVDVARILIALIIVVILLRFASALETQLPKVLGNFPQGGLVGSSIVQIIAVFVAYNSLQPLAVVLFERENNWIFQVTFLLLLCYPLYRGGSAFYKGIDDISSFFTSSMDPKVEMKNCPKCGTKNEISTKFCAGCGVDLRASSVNVQTTRRCGQCGTPNKADAKHCIDCGTTLS